MSHLYCTFLLLDIIGTPFYLGPGLFSWRRLRQVYLIDTTIQQWDSINSSSSC